MHIWPSKHRCEECGKKCGFFLLCFVHHSVGGRTVKKKKESTRSNPWMDIGHCLLHWTGHPTLTDGLSKARSGM